MSAKTIHSSRVAYFEEEVQGTPPVSWADEQLVDHTAAETDGIKQSLIADPTLQLSVNEAGSELMIKGLRSCEFKLGLKLHGSGVVTAGGSQVVKTPLMRIAEHCWGGIHRSNSTTCTGGTAEVPELTAVTNIVAGCIIGFEDITSPGINAGKVFLRRVVSIDELAVTLDRALPFTPAATDKVHGVATIYFDEEVLVDSSDPVGTFSWFVQKARTGASDLCWELMGCAATLAFTGLTRNGIPGLDLAIMAANFRHGGVSAPTWSGTAAGNAQLAIGRDTQFSLTEYGVTTNTLMQCAAVAIEPGIPRVALDTVTEVDDNMEGRWAYSVEPAPTTATITIGAHSGAYETKLQADTQYALSYSQVAGAGKVWGIFIPHAQIAESPGDTPINAVHGAQVKFQARVPDDAGTTTIATSKILLAIG